MPNEEQTNKPKTTKKNAIKQTKSSSVGSIAEPTINKVTPKITSDISKKLIDDIISTVSVTSALDLAKIEKFTTLSNNRTQLYNMLDIMGNSSDVASILKVYTDEICQPADNGKVVWCEAADPKIAQFGNYLLDCANVDKNIKLWAYCLLKYGDVYLKLYRNSDYNDPLFHETKNNPYQLNEDVHVQFHNDNDKYSYFVEMVNDPSTMFELTKYGRIFGYIEVPNKPTDDTFSFYVDSGDSSKINYAFKSSDINIYQANDFVHAYLVENFNRIPEQINLSTDDTDASYKYTVTRGKSILADSYKVWREKTLIEGAILLSRLTKASVVRNVSVEVGDMSKSKVQSTLRDLKTLFEQKTSIDTGNGMTEYNNPGPIENTVYTATHNGIGAISVNTIGGDVNIKDLADLDEWVNKFYACYGIPKAYFGYTNDGAGFNGGTSLSILSSVFAKEVIASQNALIQMLTEMLNLFFINKGCSAYVNNFTLKMKQPVTQEELDSRASLSNKVQFISSIQGILNDVEDRKNRLTILKELISNLLPDSQGITNSIANEITQIENNAKITSSNADEQPADSLNSVLSNAKLSEDLKTKTLENKTIEQLAEEATEASEVLPTPEELDDQKDFTNNNTNNK